MVQVGAPTADTSVNFFIRLTRPHIAVLLERAETWQAMLDSGEVKTRAELAKRFGCAAGRVSNILNLLRASGPTLTYHYDGEGGDLNNGHHGLLEAAAIGTTDEAYTHDAMGRVQSYSVTSNEELVYSAEVTARDGSGRVTAETITRADLTTLELTTELREYSYDGLGQLRAAAYTHDGVPEPVILYEYDDNGNLLCSHGTVETGCTTASEYNVNNQLKNDGEYSYEYDPSGRLASKTVPMGVSTYYDYDLLGSLRGVTATSGGSNLVSDVTYVNDHAGRRVQRKVFNPGGESFAERRQYIWSGNLQIEAELDGSGEIISRFVYGHRPNVPELILRGEDTYRVITDSRGSPVYVFNIEDGHVLLEASYDVWGNPRNITIDGVYRGDEVTAWPIPHGFAGGLFDRTTKLVRFGARDYDPSTGRWTARDPSLFGGQQSNLYVYSHNDPVNFIDPQGEVATIVVGTLAGATVGAIGALATGGDWVDGALIGAGAGFIAGTFGAGGVLLAESGAAFGIKASVLTVGVGAETAYAQAAAEISGRPEAWYVSAAGALMGGVQSGLNRLLRGATGYNGHLGDFLGDVHGGLTGEMFQDPRYNQCESR